MSPPPSRDLVPTVVHLGPGVFHRAHQAAYADWLLRQGSPVGAIWGVSFRSSRLRDALRRTRGSYHLIERAGTVDGPEQQTLTPIRSILGCSVLPTEAPDVFARLCDPAVTVVSLTVTENGYCATHPGGGLDLGRDEVAHDLTGPPVPRSVPGLLTTALSRRREAGTAPFTVVSCDNLPGNGDATRRVVTELATAMDQRLGDWIADQVAFPNSMVDRIVPSTTQATVDGLRALGIEDPWPVVTEPFSQWVLEDHFPSGRPAWGEVGVELVDDVSAHEAVKLRVLNAGHSALAYLGLLCGHRRIDEAAADPMLAGFVRALWAREVLPTLASPPGWDLAAYAETTLSRFANSAISYPAAKVAGDGSQKLPVRLMPTVADRLSRGQSAALSAIVVAAWIAVLRGPGAGSFEGTDEALDRWLHAAGAPAPGPAGEEVDRLLGMPGFETGDPGSTALFVDDVVVVAERLWAGDVRTVLSAALGAGSRL
jgi:fructuronate reductase